MFPYFLSLFLPIFGVIGLAKLLYWYISLTKYRIFRYSIYQYTALVLILASQSIFRQFIHKNVMFSVKFWVLQKDRKVICIGHKILPDTNISENCPILTNAIHRPSLYFMSPWICPQKGPVKLKVVLAAAIHKIASPSPLY